MQALVLLCYVISLVAADCDYNGQTYPVDSDYPSSDGCNSCSCTELGTICTQVECSTAVPVLPSRSNANVPSCASTLCAAGTQCTETANGPTCIAIPTATPRPNCTTVDCPSGTKCVDTSSGPRCDVVRSSKPRPPNAPDTARLPKGSRSTPRSPPKGDTTAKGRGRGRARIGINPIAPSAGNIPDGPPLANGEKAGKCPKLRSGAIGTCANSCNVDTDCGGDQKCCSTGCGSVCRSPDNKSSQPSSCALVQCVPDFVCVEKSGIPRCVPAPPVISKAVGNPSSTFLSTSVGPVAVLPWVIFGIGCAAVIGLVVAAIFLVRQRRTFEDSI